jgi:hypothetical protein
MRRPPALLAIGLLTLVGAGAVAGCEPQPSARFERSFTSTVAVGAETRLALLAGLPIELTAEGRRADVLVTLDAVFTASTATAAREAAEAVMLVVERSGSDLGVSLPAVAGAGIEGVLRVRMPADLSLVARVEAGTFVGSGFRRPVEVAAADGASVSDAEDDVLVLVTDGPILVQSRLTPGRGLEAATGRGDIDLRLPAALSAAVAADAPLGQVIVEHPALPIPVGPNRQRYRAEVSGGLSPVSLLTQAGSIVIRAQ